jgi:hypothetical protein
MTGLVLEYAGYGGTQPLVVGAAGPPGPTGPTGPAWTPTQGRVTASGGSTHITPGVYASVLVTLEANTMISIGAGYVGQTLRLDLRQDATGGRTVAFDTMVVFGTDVQIFTASTAANTRDLVQLICADGVNWMLVAATHGFGV